MHWLSLLVAIMLSCGVANAQDTGVAPAEDGSILDLTALRFEYVHLSLPGWPTDRIATTRRFGTPAGRLDAAGPGLEAKFRIDIGYRYDSPLYLEWNGSMAQASARTTSVRSLDRDHFLSLRAGETPDGTVALSTLTDNTGAHADGTVILTDGTLTPPTITSSAFSPAHSNASIAQYAATNTDAGGVFLALVTDGDTPAAQSIGALTDDRGFVLVGIGDLDGTAIRTRVAEHVTLMRQDVVFAMPVETDGNWILTPKLGVSGQWITRKANRRTIVDIDEGEASLIDFPAIGLAHRDRLKSRFLGGVAGLAADTSLGPAFDLSIALTTGLSQFATTYRGSSRAIFPGAAGADFEERRATREGLAGFAGFMTDLAYRPDGRTRLHVFGRVDYMSAMPHVIRSANGEGVSIRSRGIWSQGVGIGFERRF